MGSHDALAILALMLAGGKLAGQLGQRWGMPSAVGSILLGLLVGPTALSLVSPNESLDLLSRIGVILLMFMVGLETDTDTMRRVSVPAFAVAAGGVVLPFAAGLGVGMAFDLPLKEGLFLGAILTATSVSITAQTLRELGRLRSQEGTTILAAAVIDDILGIVVLTLVAATTADGDPVTELAKVAIFLPCAFIGGRYILRPLVDRFHVHFSGEMLVTLLIAAALSAAWLSERFGGMAEVTGAYAVGVLLANSSLDWEGHSLDRVVYSFFVPLFFVAIGVQADLGTIGNSADMVVALLVAAIVAKTVGCYLGARLCGFPIQESTVIGVGMVSRGEVALVIAGAGLSAGVIGNEVFSAAILMTLATTLLTPVLLKVAYRKSASTAVEEAASPPESDRLEVSGVPAS